MLNKIIGYSYFGRSRGLQTVNGGGIPASYPVENIVDLDMRIFEVQPNTRLYRVSRILQDDKINQFFSIYEYATEKDSHRRGTFLGATIGLSHSIVSPEIITTYLVGMIEYLSKYLNGDINRKFIISELRKQDLKVPRGFETLNSVAQGIDFPIRKPKNKSALISLRKSHELLEANAFFGHALNRSELYEYDELYATADEKIILAPNPLYSLDIDLHFNSIIGEKLTLLKDIEQKRDSIAQEILEKEKAYEEEKSSQISTLNKIEENKDKLRRGVGALKIEKERIENELKARNAALENLPDSIDKLKRELSELRGEVSEKDQESSQLAELIRKKEGTIKKLENDIDKLKLERSSKLGELKQLEAKINAELEKRREFPVLSFFKKLFSKKTSEEEITKELKGDIVKRMASILLFSFVGIIILLAVFNPFSFAGETQTPSVKDKSTTVIPPTDDFVNTETVMQGREQVNKANYDLSEYLRDQIKFLEDGQDSLMSGDGLTQSQYEMLLFSIQKVYREWVRSRYEAHELECIDIKPIPGETLSALLSRVLSEKKAKLGRFKSIANLAEFTDIKNPTDVQDGEIVNSEATIRCCYPNPENNNR